MAKKKRNNEPGPRRRRPPPRFGPGDRVRVRSGTCDPDFPDIPIGGWSGTVAEVKRRRQPRTYLIQWDERTLAQLHPIYRRRCARDGLDVETMWLEEEALETDEGEPVPIQQPTQLVPRPLRLTDTADRLRAIFGLTSDDDVPPVSAEGLCTFQRHLAKGLDLPFAAKWAPLGVPPQRARRCQVLALLDPGHGDPESGLLCEVMADNERLVVPLVNLVVVPRGANRQRLADYRNWFLASYEGDREWLARRFLDDRLDAARPAADLPSLVELLATILKLCLAGALYISALATAWWSLDGAALASKTGAILLGLLGILLGAAVRAPAEASARPVHHRIAAGFLGLTVGGLVGAMLGAMVIAFLGALAGGLIGALAVWLRARLLKRSGPYLIGALAGALIGVVVQSYLHDADRACSAAVWGALVGAIGGPLLAFAGGLALHRAVGDEGSES